MKTLVIIDMQRNLLQPALERDESAVMSVIKNISNLMYEFKYQGWPIMMVEFVQYNTPIIRQLMDVIADYKCRQMVKKDQVDGSDAILFWQKYWKWPTNFTICGIYGEECVAETVNGLIVREPKARIEVMVDAIYPGYHDWGINKDLHDKQVRLVKQGDWNVNTFV